MIFVVSNEKTQWFLAFGPDSVFLTAKDVVEESVMSSQKSLLPTWEVLMSQRKDLLNNHSVQNPITPNQRKTFEMWEEVLASAGAQRL